MKKIQELLYKLGEKIMDNWVLPIILLALMTGLLKLQSFLQMPITTDVYMVVTVFLFGILIAFGVLYLRRFIYLETFLIDGFIWIKGRSDTILGPYCPRCKSAIYILENSVDEEFERFTRFLTKEEQQTYKYYCQKCPKEYQSPFTLIELEERAMNKIKNVD